MKPTRQGMGRHPARRLGFVSRRRTGPAVQRGVSSGVVMIVIVLVVFFATLAIKMVPAYTSFLQVRSLMDRFDDKPEVVSRGRHSIMVALSSQLGIEGIKDLKNTDFVVKKVGDGIELSVDYEVRKHLFFNIDVVMHFQHVKLLQ